MFLLTQPVQANPIIVLLPSWRWSNINLCYATVTFAHRARWDWPALPSLHERLGFRIVQDRVALLPLRSLHEWIMCWIAGWKKTPISLALILQHILIWFNRPIAFQYDVFIQDLDTLYMYRINKGERKVDLDLVESTTLRDESTKIMFPLPRWLVVRWIGQYKLYPSI